MTLIVQSALGLVVLPLIAWLASEERDAVRWRTVLAGMALQLALAAALLKLAVFRGVFIALNAALNGIQEATRSGTSMVFGYLGGGALPYEPTGAGSSFVLAFQALPVILVVSAVSALLFHWRILPVLVAVLSGVLQRTMGIGGALGIGAAANAFIGMVEAPLLVRPYLGAMSRSELFALMTCGMATIAGTVLVLYATLLTPVLPDALGQILTASLISVPAALLISALMVPSRDAGTNATLTDAQQATGSMDAVTRGTLQGVELLLNVTAMLIVLVALVSLVNLALGLLPPLAGAPVTLQRLLGLAMSPVMWLIGVPWSEASVAGSLMGTKTVLNELLAYTDLAALPAEALSPRTRLIVTYALCGFANLGSLGILIGGLGTMVPERRSEIVALGMKSLVAGTLSTLLTGAVVGLLTMPQASVP